MLARSLNNERGKCTLCVREESACSAYYYLSVEAFRPDTVVNADCGACVDKLRRVIIPLPTRHLPYTSCRLRSSNDLRKHYSTALVENNSMLLMERRVSNTEQRLMPITSSRYTSASMSSDSDHSALTRQSSSSSGTLRLPIICHEASTSSAVQTTQDVEQW